MDTQRAKEILESLGIIEVKYKNDPVWLEGLSTDKDGKIQVKDLTTNEHCIVDIADLKE